LLFSLAIYLISCWWCWYFGGSFGQRTLIEFYPVAAYPVACLISESSKKSRLFIQSFIILCIVLNLIQSYQSKNNILHYDAMNEEKYWKVFLKTSDKYKWKLFSNPNDKTDPDIENRLLFKCFYDFDAGVKNWIPFINTDIADEALSGNKVLSFSELKQPVRFFYEKDSLIQTGTRLRVKAWFTGDPASMNIKLFQIHNADTLLATDIAALFKRTWSTVPVFGSYSNNWSLYIMDLQIPEISKQNKIGIEINRSGKKIMMDDIMVSLYR
jgi:hypothetical protein